MIFGINTTSDISKLLYVISRAVRRVKFVTILNITSGLYAKDHVQIMLLFVYTTTRKRLEIFTCRYLKLSWNITALSQLNCSNFSCSSIKSEIFLKQYLVHMHVDKTNWKKQFSGAVLSHDPQWETNYKLKKSSSALIILIWTAKCEKSCKLQKIVRNLLDKLPIENCARMKWSSRNY